MLSAGSGTVQVWVGLVQSGSTCSDAGCNSNVQWVDGSQFSYDSNIVDNIDFDTDDRRCARTFNFVNGFISTRGISCTTSIKYKVLCQHPCRKYVKRDSVYIVELAIFCVLLFQNIAKTFISFIGVRHIFINQRVVLWMVHGLHGLRGLTAQ